MTRKTPLRFKGKVKDDYLDLIKNFPLTSIRSDDDFVAAQRVIDRLLAEGELTGGAELYLDALSDLVAAYEEIHHTIPVASDAELLKHFLAAKGVNQTELHRATGIPKSSISEIINGKKKFSRQHIATLANYFEVDQSILTQNF